MSRQPGAEDAAAFEAGVLEHLDPLFNLAMWMARDRAQAEDLVQEACLRALRFRHQFQPGTNLRAWLFQILRSVFITQYRRRGRAGHHVDLETLEAHGANPVAGREAGAEPFARVDIDAALERLPEEYRTVVVLADIEGLSMAEMALAMSCPVGTVKSRLFRARAQLQKMLAEYRRREA
ncbi:MAG TPA: sigma-70 family RNA polymerase sigma factor [Candidatus Methylomirabilis sp.]|jgi:RNA polymerase sigma-70 factor (ECF subfamily)